MQLSHLLAHNQCLYDFLLSTSDDLKNNLQSWEKLDFRFHIHTTKCCTVRFYFFDVFFVVFFADFLRPFFLNFSRSCASSFSSSSSSSSSSLS
mmetsp:Transcript_52091/g.125779  ORF Transcript_52091/g.125779 Transcript_52091/m.125779 type:complete len:93 (+) Transcript_52091:1355-1633(+)